MALPTISRLRSAEIQNTLEADAGDVSAEFEQLVATANSLIAQSNQNESDISDNDTDITTIQGEITAVEADIEALDLAVAQNIADIAALEADVLGSANVLVSSTENAHFALANDVNLYFIGGSSTTTINCSTASFADPDGGRIWRFVCGLGSSARMNFYQPGGTLLFTLLPGQSAIVRKDETISTYTLISIQSRQPAPSDLHVVVSADSPFTPSLARTNYLVDSDGGSIMITLPAAADGKEFRFFCQGYSMISIAGSSVTPGASDTVVVQAIQVGTGWRVASISTI